LYTKPLLSCFLLNGRVKGVSIAKRLNCAQTTGFPSLHRPGGSHLFIGPAAYTGWEGCNDLTFRASTNTQIIFYIQFNLPKIIPWTARDHASSGELTTSKKHYYLSAFELATCTYITIDMRLFKKLLDRPWPDQLHRPCWLCYLCKSTKTSEHQLELLSEVGNI